MTGDTPPVGLIPALDRAPVALDTVAHLRDRPEAPALEPLLIPASVAGPLCGRSEASWWRDHASKRVPAPLKLGGSTLWRTQELREWVAANCPDRPTWEALRTAQRNGQAQEPSRR